MTEKSVEVLYSETRHFNHPEDATRRMGMIRVVVASVDVGDGWFYLRFISLETVSLSGGTTELVNVSTGSDSDAIRAAIKLFDAAVENFPIPPLATADDDVPFIGKFSDFRGNQ